MHRFLRAAGFSRLSELDDEERLIQDICAHSDSRRTVKLENGYLFGEFSRRFGKNIGVTVCGILDKNNHFHVQYYFPYGRGDSSLEMDSVAVDRHMRTLSFAAACDDMRIGTTIIFYVANAADYLLAGSPKTLEGTSVIQLCGLADSGAVLLPVSSDQRPLSEDPGKLEYRSNLFKAAQNGDEEAIESLTMEDYDLYTSITRRVRNEDVYTIVDSYFIPYGMECDLYNVMGEIKQVTSSRNVVTDENIIRLQIVTNDIPIDVCINEKDLMGEPLPGRRFKGVIWLQGQIMMPGGDVPHQGS